MPTNNIVEVPNTVTNSKRIAKNTMFLYIRMLMVMAVTLYTSRIVLNMLGVTDYGIYNVVGGIVSMLGFMSNAMSNAVQRFLSFEMGKNNWKRVNTIFNIALQAHIGIAILVVCIMEVAGVWYTNNFLNVPTERLNAAHWVLQCTIISMFFTIIQVPYNGIIIAKEDMGIYAYISIIEVVLKLAACYLLFIESIDTLKLYSVVMMIVTIIIVLIYKIYCIRTYKECKVCKVKDSSLLKQMASFASWNLLGEVAWVFNGQVINIALNFFFGPVINAAAAISVQVNAAVSKFVSNFQMAVNPQIIKSYASNEIEEMKKLLFHSTKLSYYLLLALSLPIMIEMDIILNLWLIEVPQYAIVFCQLGLVCSLVSTVSNLFSQVVRANGKIRNYQIVVSCVAFSAFPLSCLALMLGASPYSTLVINIFISVFLIYIRIRLTKKIINITMWKFFMNVVYPIVKVSVISVSISLLLDMFIEGHMLNFLVVTPSSFIVVCVASYSIGMDKRERGYILDAANKMAVKLNIRKSTCTRKTVVDGH